MNNDKRKLELLKEAQRRKAFSTNAGAYTPHVYLVFNDPVFREDLHKLQKEVQALYDDKSWNSTEEKTEITLLKATEMIRKVADTYRISIADLTLCADGSFDIGGDYGVEDNEYGGVRLLPDGENRLHYVIGPKTTLKQIEREWPFIQGIQEVWFKQKPKRSRSSNDPQLVYAIFKAHELDGLSYAQTYRLYEKGELIGYTNRSKKQFNSSEELKKFYHRHSPAYPDNSVKYPNLSLYVRH